MKYQISDETISRTTECPHNFQCLRNGFQNMCSIDRRLGDNGLMIKEKMINTYCPYMMPFGEAYICNCPTRIDLFENYSV